MELPICVQKDADGKINSEDPDQTAFSDFGMLSIYLFRNTLKCLNIGTPKINNFPFVPNGKLMVFRCPRI